MNSNRGFTLVEIVAVLLLLGIISIFVSPRFSSRSGFSDAALRDEFMASYRVAQQRAMYDHASGVCYSLSISGSGFEPRRSGVFFGNLGQVSFSGDYSGLSVSPPNDIYFDGLGSTFVDTCGGTPIAGSLVYAIGSVSVEVFSTGYIRAL